MKKHHSSKFLISLLTALISIFLFSFTAFALQGTSKPVKPAHQSSSPVRVQSSVQSSKLSSVPSNSSVQSSSKPKQESSAVHSYPSVSSYVSSNSSAVSSEVSSESSSEKVESSFPEETSVEESVIEESIEESYEESSEISEYVDVIDPFYAIHQLDTILPVDEPGFVPITESSVESSAESSVQSSVEENSKSESSKKAVAEVSRTDSNILNNTPPIPADEASSIQLYTSNTVETDNSSFWIGIIIWSVIGVVVTAILIVVLHSKGNNTETIFGNNRFYNNANQKPRQKKFFSDKYK